MKPLDLVLLKLEGVRKEGDQWKARCPSHDDRHQSLSVAEGREGRVVVNCHADAGCTSESIVEAMGLQMRNLFPKKDVRSLGPIVRTYSYEDEDGRELFQATRHDPKDFRQRRPDGRGEYVWGLGSVRRVLFRLPQLIAARIDAEDRGFSPLVWITEGEKDVESLEAAGLLATCNPMGAGKWDPGFSETLRGFHCVIVRDRDESGYAHARAVALSLENRAASVRCVEAKEGKDATDHLQAGFRPEEFVDVDPMEPCPPELRSKKEPRAPKPPKDPGEAKPEPSPPGPSEDRPPRSDDPSFMKTDLGNARRLAHHFGEEMRFCSDWERFLIWDGVRWRQDTPGNRDVRALAHSVTDLMLQDADATVRKWGKDSQGSQRLSAMLRESQSLPGVGVRSRDLDTHDHLIACANGVVDLRLGRLVDAPRELLITKRVNARWDPDARCPEFTTFLRTIMKDRKGLVDLLLRALGYSLSGSVKEQKFFLLYGERGRNGKTTLMELMQELMGDELCFTINKRLLTHSGGDAARFATAELEGKRMVYANETSRGAKLDLEFVKDFVGGSTIKAEKKGKDETQFKNKGKLWYAVNSLPAADIDNSFIDRVVPIPFEQSFYAEGHEKHRPGDLPPDPDLPDRLAAEMDGIFALLVRAYQRWNELGTLGQPEEVRALRAQYESENDSVADWMRERCRVDSDGRVKQADAWKDYSEWAKINKPSIAHRRKIHFKHDLLGRPGIEEREPKGVFYFAGIELTDSAALPLGEDDE